MLEINMKSKIHTNKQHLEQKTLINAEGSRPVFLTPGLQ